MTKKTENILKKKCCDCVKKVSAWADSLDPEHEKVEDMKSHAKNYCSACAAIRSL